MSINLQKGQKIILTKATDKAAEPLSRVMVGLGWNEAKGADAEVDCDASVIICGSDGKLLGDNVKNVVYFKNLNWNGAVVHQGDNRTGGDDGDAEQIMVDLAKMPDEAKKIVFVANIYDAKAKNQHFGMLENAYIRIVNTDSGEEICRYDLNDNYSGMSGLIAGELHSENGEWLFSALGKTVAEASRLGAIVALYR